MPDVVNDQQAISILREIVKGNEDFVYTAPADGMQCLYVNGAQPSCGVGQALYRLGVPLSQLELLDPEDEADGRRTRNSTPAINLDEIDFLPFTVDVSAAWIFGVFQQKQDTGSTWGEALHSAEDIYKLATSRKT